MTSTYVKVFHDELNDTNLLDLERKKLSIYQIFYNRYVPIGSEKYIKMLIVLYFCIWFIAKIWLNCFLDDHYLAISKKFEKKKLLIPIYKSKIIQQYKMENI